MNLKEAFRYQNFLESLMRSACSSIQNREHCLTVTKTHCRNKVNPDGQDLTEVVRVEDFFPNDEVIRFMEWLVEEKGKLTRAIGAVKSSLELDIDAAIETNKFRQTANNAMKSMLRYTPYERTEQGRDYKFNVEGNQVPYFYEIEVTAEDSYNRDNAKSVMRSMISTSDKVSAEIDAALINTFVDYEVVFDVNETFEDVVKEFIEKIPRELDN